MFMSHYATEVCKCPSAEQGYARAQFYLGHMYIYGKGVSRDKVEAVKWYRKAAEQGDEEAKKRLKKLGY